jgi:ferredoxin-type protein NapH
MLLRNYKFLIARRVTQIMVIFLFFAGNAFGWSVLKGNLSAAMLLEVVPMSDPFHVLQMFAAMTVPSSEALIGAGLVIAFYAILAGRAFCGWVCPMNIVTDTANWIRNVLGIEDTWQMSRNIRYWIVGLSLVISFFIGVAAFEWISPISMLHRGIIYGMGFGWAAVLTVFLFDFLVMKNSFCGHLCPLGGFYALVGRFNIIKPRHDKEKCSLCMKCFEKCPEKQVLHIVGKQSGLVLSGECINCGRCVEVCDDNSIFFSSNFGLN